MVGNKIKNIQIAMNISLRIKNKKEDMQNMIRCKLRKLLNGLGKNIYFNGKVKLQMLSFSNILVI